MLLFSATVRSNLGPLKLENTWRQKAVNLIRTKCSEVVLYYNNSVQTATVQEILSVILKDKHLIWKKSNFKGYWIWKHIYLFFFFSSSQKHTYLQYIIIRGFLEWLCNDKTKGKYAFSFLYLYHDEKWSLIKHISKSGGLLRDLNPGPLAP